MFVIRLVIDCDYTNVNTYIELLTVAKCSYNCIRNKAKDICIT